jgi:cytochrome c biogenesis factor
LVVVSGTVLPPICVKTNQPVTREGIVHKHLHWRPPWVMDLIAFLMARETCILTFGLDPRVQKDYRNRLRLKIVAAIGLLLVLPVLVITNAMTFQFVVAFTLVLAGIAILFVEISPLRVVDYRDGQFLIRGFSKEYLERFKKAIPAGVGP